MHVVWSYSSITLYVLYCQHIPCADPFSGCNVLCCRLFRRGVRFVRLLPCSSAMPLELMDSLYLPSLPLLSFLDGLKPYYCNNFSFEKFDVISVWLLLCYKSSSTVRVSITDPGMTLMHRDLTVWGRSLQDGIRARAECWTRPLR